jgi:hypothetical protein
MPLRDHFRPPISLRRSWEGFHAAWPTMLVARMLEHLPAGYDAEPRVHLGSVFEIDVGAFEDGDSPAGFGVDSGGAVAYAAPEPTLTVDAALAEQYEYEVLVFDDTADRQLVAAVEFVSPANKDRVEHRRAFVTKCAALLQKGVCVAIVDPVTVRRANLYAELLDFIECSDPSLPKRPPATYAVTCRTHVQKRKPKLQSWAYPMNVGHPLPEIPLWLSGDLAVPLDLESSYEDTCRILRLPK